MKKWLFGVAFLALVALSQAQAQDKGVTVFYLSGWDCPPCHAWKKNVKPGFVSSPEFGKLKYVEIEAPNLKHVMQEQYWKAEYRPVLKQLKERVGTPRFIIVKDGQVVADELGYTPWTRAWQKIKELVAAS